MNFNFKTHVQEEEEVDYDLQRAIELSLTTSSNNNYIHSICSTDALILDESRLLTRGFTAYLPYTISQLCFSFFYAKISMEQLQETSDNALGLRLLFRRICSVPHTKRNEDILNTVLTKWRVHQMLDENREHIVECVRKCVRIDNVYILRIILKCLYNATLFSDIDYDEDEDNNDDDDLWDKCRSFRMNEVVKYINYAAECGAMECITLLLQDPIKVDWVNQFCNPLVLYNAVKYNGNNLKLMHFIVDCMEITGIQFVCDDVLEEIIRYDAVQIAKRIVINGWHKINEYDTSFAKYENLRCHKWITQRTKAYNYLYESVNQYNGDYDEW